MKDNINPRHYKRGGLECIDVIAAATEGLQGMDAVCTANIIKYVFRWKQKNGVEDLNKARWYLDRLIAEDEKQGLDSLCTKLKACQGRVE